MYRGIVWHRTSRPTQTCSSVQCGHEMYKRSDLEQNLMRVHTEVTVHQDFCCNLYEFLGSVIVSCPSSCVMLCSFPSFSWFPHLVIVLISFTCLWFASCVFRSSSLSCSLSARLCCSGVSLLLVVESSCLLWKSFCFAVHLVFVFLSGSFSIATSLFMSVLLLVFLYFLGFSFIYLFICVLNLPSFECFAFGSHLCSPWNFWFGANYCFCGWKDKDFQCLCLQKSFKVFFQAFYKSVEACFFCFFFCLFFFVFCFFFFCLQYYALVKLEHTVQIMSNS